MAERNPDRPQSDDPDLLADLVRLLRVVGPLGRLNVADMVVPVINMGDVVSRTITATQPIFRSIDVFTAGVQTAAPANFTHATTGLLQNGVYDIQLYISPHTTEAHVWTILHFRDLPFQTWKVIVPIDGPGFFQTLAYDFIETDELHILNDTVFGAGVQSIATIFARLRI